MFVGAFLKGFGKRPRLSSCDRLRVQLVRIEGFVRCRASLTVVDRDEYLAMLRKRSTIGDERRNLDDKSAKL
jgi:hypothetical protein